MLKWGWHVYKACKVCIPSSEVCKKCVKKCVIKCVKEIYCLQSCLQGFYRVFTDFIRYMTYFTYLLIKDEKIKDVFSRSFYEK